MDAPHAMDSASSDGDAAKSLIPGLAAAFIHDAVTAALCFKSLYYDVACVADRYAGFSFRPDDHCLTFRCTDDRGRIFPARTILVQLEGPVIAVVHNDQ